jgi:hypothetical protein
MNSPHTDTGSAADATLDQMLRALGQVPVAEDLAQRTLQTLHEAHRHNAATTRRWHWQRWATFATAVTTLALAATLSMHTRPKRGTIHLASAPAASTPTPKTALTPQRALNLNSVSLQPHSAMLARTSTHPSAAVATAAPSVDALAQRAIENMQAASEPAPPLPLTAQEQRFLHLVQSHDTADLAEVAELDPGVRAEHEALEHTAFERFFNPPPPAGSSPASTTTPHPNGDHQ